MLTPKVAGELDLPPIRYSYFNPDSRRYEVASTSPTHVRIAPGTLASADTAQHGDAACRCATRYRGAPRAPLHEHPVFWALLALAPVPALSLRGARASLAARRASSVDSAATARRARARDCASHDACEVRRAYTGALAERLALEPESFTRAGRARARAAPARRVDGDRARGRAVSCASSTRRRSRRTGTLPARRRRARDAAVSRRRRRSAAAARTSRVCATSCIVGSARGRRRARRTRYDATAARDAFDDGVAAYEHHDFVAAREAFIASVDGRAARAGRVGQPRHGVVGRCRHRAQRRGVAARTAPRAARVRRARARRAGARAAVDVRRLRAAGSGGVGVRSRRAALVRRVGHCGVSRDRASARVGSRTVTDARRRGRDHRDRRICADRSPGRATSRRRAPHGVVEHRSRARRRARRDGDHRRSGARHGPQGAWSACVLDDGRDGWIESAALVSLDTRDASRSRRLIARTA